MAPKKRVTKETAEAASLVVEQSPVLPDATSSTTGPTMQDVALAADANLSGYLRQTSGKQRKVVAQEGGRGSKRRAHLVTSEAHRVMEGGELSKQLKQHQEEETTAVAMAAKVEEGKDSTTGAAAAVGEKRKRGVTFVVDVEDDEDDEKGDDTAAVDSASTVKRSSAADDDDDELIASGAGNVMADFAGGEDDDEWEAIDLAMGGASPLKREDPLLLPTDSAATVKVEGSIKSESTRELNRDAKVEVTHVKIEFEQFDANRAAAIAEGRRGGAAERGEGFQNPDEDGTGFASSAAERDRRAKMRRSLREQNLSTVITKILVHIQRGQRLFQQAHNPLLARLLLSPLSNSPSVSDGLDAHFRAAVDAARALVDEAKRNENAKPDSRPVWVTPKKDLCGNCTSAAAKVLIDAINAAFTIEIEHEGEPGPDGKTRKRRVTQFLATEKLPPRFLRTELTKRRLMATTTAAAQPLTKIVCPSPAYLSVIFLALAAKCGLDARLVTAFTSHDVLHLNLLNQQLAEGGSGDQNGKGDGLEVLGVFGPIGRTSSTTAEIEAVTVVDDAEAQEAAEASQADAQQATKQSKKQQKSSTPQPPAPAPGKGKKAPPAPAPPPPPPALPKSWIWCEVFCPIRQAFISVNPCALTVTHWNAPYVVAFGGDHALDVTPRYVSKFSEVYKERSESMRAGVTKEFLWRLKYSYDGFSRRTIKGKKTEKKKKTAKTKKRAEKNGIKSTLTPAAVVSGEKRKRPADEGHAAGPRERDVADATSGEDRGSPRSRRPVPQRIAAIAVGGSSRAPANNGEAASDEDDDEGGVGIEPYSGPMGHTERLLQHLNRDWTAKTRARMPRELKQLERLLYADPVPATQKALKGHPLYVLETDFTKYEAVYPREGPHLVGNLKGVNVYKRAAITRLKSMEAWLRYSRSLIPQPDGTPPPHYKEFKAPASRPFAKPTLLFGFWQTRPFEPAPLGSDGVIHKYENTKWYLLLRRGGTKIEDRTIEIGDDAEKCYAEAAADPALLPPLPAGLARIVGCKGIHRIAARMSVDFAFCVTGFIKRHYQLNLRGSTTAVPRVRWEPVLEGLVVKSGDEMRLRTAYAEWIAVQQANEAARRRERAMTWWELLIRRALARQRLLQQFQVVE